MGIVASDMLGLVEEGKPADGASCTFCPLRHEDPRAEDPEDSRTIIVGPDDFDPLELGARSITLVPRDPPEDDYLSCKKKRSGQSPGREEEKIEVRISILPGRNSRGP